MADNIVLPPHIAASLAKVAREVRPEIALEKIIHDYVELKLELVTIKMEDFKKKYSMKFEEFAKACSEGTLDKSSYSHEVEEDYREWESLVTLRDYYEELRYDWTIKK